MLDLSPGVIIPDSRANIDDNIKRLLAGLYKIYKKEKKISHSVKVCIHLQALYKKNNLFMCKLKTGSNCLKALYFLFDGRVCGKAKVNHQQNT